MDVIDNKRKDNPMTVSHEQRKHVVLGAGPLGLAVMDALIAQEKQVTVVNRSGSTPERLPELASMAQADLNEPDEVASVVHGADTVFFCAAPPYADWPQAFPRMARSVVQGVGSAGATLVFGDNLYMYGPTHGKPMHENLPYAATSRKGLARAEVANILMDAHESGELQVAIGRGSDFFGPRVTDSAFGERVFGAALQGKTVDVLGDVDQPHSYTYIRDFGEALALLSSHERAFGEIWHVPNGAPRTTQQWLNMIAEQLGHPLKVRSAGRWMVTVLSIFNADLREMKEMMYEFEEPFIVDDTKFREAFDQQPTEPSAAIEATLDWYRQHWVS